MKQHFKFSARFYMTIMLVACLIGLLLGKASKEYDFRLEKQDQVSQTTEKGQQNTTPTWSIKEPSQAAEFISGPVAASLGELCVFRLSDAKTYADWCIVPEATCYIDSSGSSLAFASNNRATYTIIAAIAEDGIPKILTHVCEYGLQPQPDPSPTPNPDPTPKPNPPPNLSLSDWVTQNVPEAGRHQCAALASCYEATANAIENGSILTQAAAFSTIRTASQTKIDVEIWSEFLEALSTKVNTALAGNTDVKKLGTIFREIAAGLKAVGDMPSRAEESEVSSPNIYPFYNIATISNERRAS